MPEHTFHDDELFNPETHHESSDVPVRPIFWFIVIFVVFGIVSHIVLFFLYKGFAKMEQNRTEAPQTALSRPASLDVPQNQPLLQPFPRRDAKGAEVPPTRDTPVVDLIELRAAEDKVLHSYGWVDKSKGTVRIPIEQAEEILAARLAVQGQTGGVTAPPAAAPGATPAAPAGTVTSPAGTPVSPDTGAAPATTNTAATATAATQTGGARQ